VLEEDGIQCFDLDANSLSVNGDPDLLRMSLGPGHSQPGGQEINEQLKMWQELERVKRDNEQMGMQLELLRIEKKKDFSDKGKNNGD
jgi:phage-related protein